MVDEEHGWTLAVPFTICQSRGGPHDDAAFVSGYRLGAIGQTISAPGGAWAGLILRDEKEQVDLIAMDRGLVVEVEWEQDDLPWIGILVRTPRRNGTEAGQ